jgi:hypothetical protein
MAPHEAKFSFEGILIPWMWLPEAVPPRRDHFLGYGRLRGTTLTPAVASVHPGEVVSRVMVVKLP